MLESKLTIVSAAGDFLIDESGNQFFDLCMGYGSVCLGHNYAPIVKEQQKQLQTYASPGFMETEIYVQAKQAVERYAEGYRVHGFYPSGANAAEIAVKMAMASTGRSKIISFANSMHGKTLFANKLGFESCLEDHDQIIRLPFVGEVEEQIILESCENHMRQGNVAALILEPIQMSGGGFRASAEFYHRLEALTKHYGVLEIYDEILIGFHRTGSPFFFKTHDLKPNLVLTGKAMGSGFPVSAVLHDESVVVSNTFRGGGTFFNHPMACASIIATLDAYEQLEVATHIRKIENCVSTHLPAQALSGQGALWNIDLGSVDNANAAVNELRANRVIVSYYGQYIRFFPNYQVDLTKLKEACQLVKRYL